MSGTLKSFARRYGDGEAIYPSHPIGTFSTTSRWTTLPRLGTIRGTARPSPCPNQSHVRAAIMRHHFDVPTNIPAYLSTSMGLVHVLLVVALLVLGTIIRQNIRGDNLGVVLQQAERAAEANAVGNQVFGNHDADSREAIRPQARQGLLYCQTRLSREIAVGADRHGDTIMDGQARKGLEWRAMARTNEENKSHRRDELEARI